MEMIVGVAFMVVGAVGGLLKYLFKR